jgi:hypothetical protein
MFLNKSWYRLLFLSLTTASLPVRLSCLVKTEKPYDKIVATVGVGSEKIAITKRDLEKPSLMNNLEKTSLEQFINQAVLLIEAKKFKLGNFTITASPAEVEAKIEGLKNFLGASGTKGAEFAAILEEKGLTLEELKHQVYQHVMIGHLLSFVFPEKSIVPLSAIEQYHRKNPEFLPEQVRLMVAEVDSKELNKIKSESKDFFRNLDPEKVEKRLEFIDLGMVDVEKLDDATRSIVKYSSPGHISVPEISQQELDNQVILRVFKIVEKVESRLKTLEERKAEISKVIEARENEKRYSEYVAELKEQTHIKVF